MKLIKTHKSWKVFFLQSAVLFTALIVGWKFFEQNYRISIDPQKERCLPHLLSLIDLHDQDIHTGDMVAFTASGIEPVIEDGTKMIKLVVGEAGDQIEITKDGVMLVNDQEVARGMYYATIRDIDLSKYAGKRTLSDGEFWVIGTHYKSLDSRYWGVLRDEQIIGKAFKIL
mgnify:CR=1 FL=1